MSLMFDSLAYAKRLKAAGVPEAQAEIQAEINIELVRSDLKRDIKELEQRMVIKLGSLMFVAVGAMAALVKLL